jgi:hypothetical protein
MGKVKAEQTFIRLKKIAFVERKLDTGSGR